MNEMKAGLEMKVEDKKLYTYKLKIIQKGVREVFLFHPSCVKGK